MAGEVSHDAAGPLREGLIRVWVSKKGMGQLAGSTARICLYRPYCDHTQSERAKRHMNSASVRGASRFAATSTPNLSLSVGAGMTTKEIMARFLS
jgi:hypothetical protein